MPWKVIGTDYTLMDGKPNKLERVVEFEVEDEPIGVVHGGNRVVIWTKKQVEEELPKVDIESLSLTPGSMAIISRRTTKSEVKRNAKV